jgi:hypothetical protein
VQTSLFFRILGFERSFFLLLIEILLFIFLLHHFFKLGLHVYLYFYFIFFIGFTCPFIFLVHHFFIGFSMGMLSYAFFVHLVCFRIFPFDDLFSTLIFPLHILSRVWVQINPVTMDMDDVDSSIRESQDGGGMVTFNFCCSCVIV